MAAPSDPAGEAHRLRAALATAAGDLNLLAERTAAQAGDEVGAIFTAQALFAQDPGIVDPALEQIAAGATAADAILSVTSHHADMLAAVEDDYFRARAADVRDVGRRVAGLVQGEPLPDLWHADGQPAVVVALDLDPSLVATLRRDLVTGIVLGGGTATGHAAIVARALGIPMVVGVGDAISGIPPAVEVGVDGTAGRVVIGPGPDWLASARLATIAAAANGARPASGARSMPGVRIAANVASALEATAAVEAGADAIGLVRTELLFLGRHRPPSIEEQRGTYARIRAAAGDLPVVFRTLDVGGDKPASWDRGPAEANPALGVRGIRLGLRQPGILADQLTALVQAAGDGELRVMLPMVATCEELELARDHLQSIVETIERSSGVRPSALRVGVMIEVPSAAVMADALAEQADFFSIGTNDLVQYTLAADRTNAEMAELASALQPAVLRLIRSVVRAADAHGREVTVCGEAAADPNVIPLLIGLGVDELSVTPAAISGVRAALAGLDRDRCVAMAESALRVHSLREVRALVTSE